MKFINFSDQTQWLEWRRDGIGGSDIPVLMGFSDYKTELGLWEEKCGYARPSTLNQGMIHGIQYESIARAWVNCDQQINLVPICIENEETPFLRASLDGWDDEQKIVCEIKCPISIEIIDNAKYLKSIPDHWMHQIQWNMSLCNPKLALFVVWDFRTNEGIVIKIDPDLDLQEKMRQKAISFWKLVQSGTTPELTEEDYIEIQDEDLHEHLLHYQNVCDQIKKLKDEKKETKNKIIEFGDDGNFKSFGFKIRRMLPRKTYNIEKMKMDGIDVDRYAQSTSSIGHYVIINPKSKNEMSR